jgi:hypothetical protein
MRDEFSTDVKRALAARAGHRCSVCLKPTSGPATESGIAVSDGVAAHITAASSGGPRFDPSVSPEQRRSAENGIWVCTQHGREIDADDSAFSVQVLRGLKRIREDAAQHELQRGTSPADRSAALIEFPYAATTYKLFEIIEPQAYDFATTASLHELLYQAREPTRLLNLASEVVPGIWGTHPKIAGILSTLFSNAVDLWQPSPGLLAKLEQLCNNAIQAGDWSQVASVEPLAFALSAKGCRDVHRRLLERLINESHWRDADAARIREYYGSVGIEIAAIIRHWHDPFREGLLKANDVARLIDLALSGDATVASPFARQTVLDLLEIHADLLFRSGEPDLARRVTELVAALRFVRGK